MRLATASADIAAPPARVRAALTSPDQCYRAGLSITSTWQPDARVDARYGGTVIATGNAVLADTASGLIYRLDEPATGDIDCWLSWHLDTAEPGITRVTLIATTLPADPPGDTIGLLSNLKTYLDTARQPPPQPLPRPAARPTPETRKAP